MLNIELQVHTKGSNSLLQKTEPAWKTSSVIQPLLCNVSLSLLCTIVVCPDVEGTSKEDSCRLMFITKLVSRSLKKCVVALCNSFA